MKVQMTVKAAVAAKLFATFALISMLALPTGVNARSENDFNFQSLSGASTRGDVKRKFPAAKIENQCSNGAKSSRSAEGEVACETLRLEPYKVDGTDFTLTFQFELSGNLRYISLLKLYGIPGPHGQGIDKPDIEIRYRSMADLLSTKFGPSVSNAPGAMFQLKSEVGELEWQPGRGSQWTPGGDRVNLSADAYERRQEPGKFTGSVHVFYTFARRNEAGRL